MLNATDGLHDECVNKQLTSSAEIVSSSSSHSTAALLLHQQCWFCPKLT